jgi:hypothetical protein
MMSFTFDQMGGMRVKPTAFNHRPDCCTFLGEVNASFERRFDATRRKIARGHAVFFKAETAPPLKS